jgi:quaternary ammonium compound-resistance protein SugE
MPEPTPSPDDRSLAWTLVLVAAIFEIVWAVGLPFTEGFTRPVPSVLVVAAMIAAFLPLARATRVLPIGPAYAVWTGLGATGTAGFGLLVHEEPVTTMRLLGIALVIAGVVGLRVFDRPEQAS